MEKVLLTVEEAGEVLSISRSQMYRLITSRELRPVHICRAVRIPVGEIERWLQDQMAAAQEERSAVLSVLTSSSGGRGSRKGT